MDEKFRKYRNLIVLDKDYNLTESQFLKLVEMNIFVKSGGGKWGKEDYDEFMPNDKNILASGTEILYEFHDYHLNKEVYDIISEQIYELLSKRFRYWHEIYEEEIEFNLGGYISKDDKKKYLNEKYNEIWSSDFLNSVHLKSEFLRFYKTDESELINSEDWFENLWHKTENHHILRYLATNDDIYKCFKEFIDKYVEFGRIKHITLFCKNQLELLEDNETNKSTKSQSNIPLKNTTQKILLFNKIMNYRDWEKLSENKRAEILSGIFNVHKDTVRDSLANVNPRKISYKKSLNTDIEAVSEFLIKLGVSLGDPKL